MTDTATPATTTSTRPAPGSTPSPAPGASPTATTPARRRRGPWWRTVLAKAAPILAALGGIVAVWYLVSLVVLEPSRRFLLPPPHEVLRNTLGNPQVIDPMLDALGQTVMVAVSGLTIAVALGMGWAIVMSQSRWAERILYPYAVILQTIPILALTPLIGIWMGYGFGARIVVCVIIAVFPMIANTLFGLQSATAAAHDLFTLNRATRWQRLTRLQLPAAVPAIFTGLRNAAGLSVIGAIVGDFFFQQGSPGIGGLLRTYTLRLSMDSLFLAIILTALFGVLVFSIFAALDRAVVGRLFGSTTR
ncbi:ABC transporter permease [Litorihabitans aurantiacus]|uniref:Nitrate ABC transporter permease n=1 Tax=Litorihabitans aurantiacus TaxID=1930061 RepID=A0AA37XDG0_9MICO|nr:ABC transporter permease [Litorihabitans aurantiacus]GMA31033.1 nitrate ABC transporter permease [Litorihabitans aurantiacus]